MRTGCWIICFGLLVLGGCHSAEDPLLSASRQQRGLVVVLPGIEGKGLLNMQIREGLDKGGVSWAIRIYDWTSRWGPLVSQRDETANRAKAAALATELRSYQLKYPARPIVLVGQSGGGAIAVWTAEAMKGSTPLRGLILLNASLSPYYPLDTALNSTRNGIVNFYSQRDWMLLGLGTSMAGTMDGAHVASAGLKGFEIPPATDSYKKLYQVAWSEEMSVSGHFGGHLSSAASSFVAEYVAPLVIWPDWSQQRIDSLGKLSAWETTGSPAEGIEPQPESQPASQPTSKPDSQTQPATKPAG